MSSIRLVVAVLIATAAVESGAYVSPADISRADIQSCIATLRGLPGTGDHPELETFDLRRRCPALARELETLLFEESTPGVDTSAISIEGLRDLAAIVDGFRPTTDASNDFNLDFESLDALLDDVLVEKTSEDSYWDRFLRWLEQHLRDQDSPQLGRFLDWLEGVDAPPWLGEFLIKASTVLIVLLALIVVGNELRLSGMPRRRRRQQSKPSRPLADAGTGKARAVTFDALRGLPPRALAAAIVEIVTAAFAERGWLSRSESLTNGELVRQVQENQSAIGPPFAALLGAIETIVYGDRVPDEESRRRLIASTDALLARTREGSRGAR